VNKFLQFDIEEFDLQLESDNSQFATARVQAFSSDRNRHDFICSEDVLQKTASTIYNKPILYTIDKNLNDFSTHVSPERSLICGFVAPNSAEFTRLEDGRLGLNVVAKIWKRYAPKVVELFKETKESKKGVSVEMEVYEVKDRADFLTDMISFAYTGICLLGDFVTEASPGANIQMLSFAEKENEEYKEAYIKEFASKYDDLDFKILPLMKKSVSKALESKKGSSVALAMGRWLLKNDSLTPDKVKQAWRFLKSKNPNDMDEVVLGLYGGKQGYKLFKDLSGKITEIDDKILSYFSDDENPVKNDEVAVEDSVSSEEKLFSNNGKEEMVNMADKKEEEVKKEEEKETPAEEKVEAPEEEKEEVAKGEEKKFSLDSYLDVAAALAFLEAEAESDEEMAGKIGFAVEELKKGAEFADTGKVVAGMYAKMFCIGQKMAKMAEDAKVYMAENEELKKFKADMEASQKQFAVDSTLKELSDKVVIPDDVMSEMRAKAEEFAFAEIDGWKNYCKAKSFDFAVKSKSKKNDDDIVRIGFPFGNTNKSSKDDLWAGK
jgi:ribosomal protein L9